MMPQTPYNPWVGDGHLRVLAPPGTPISPSIITYPTFSPSVRLDEPVTLIIDNRRVRIRRACPLFPPQCHPIRPLPWVALMKGLCCRLSTTTRSVALDSIDVHVKGKCIQEDAPQPMEHVVKWKAIRDQAITVTGTTVYIPQSIYQPYTEADRVRYIEKADLKEPIIFKTTHPDQWGIPLDDALRAKMKNLLDKDDSMFENCGPSVSIRLQVS
jgi:hypothetical protein